MSNFCKIPSLLLFIASIMDNFEKILNNPGLQHLAEDIFWNLDYKHLQLCREINQSSKRILDNSNQFPTSEPLFMLKKFVRRGGISEENQSGWAKVIQSSKNSEFISTFTLQFLKHKWKNGDDLPIHNSLVVQDEFARYFFKLKGFDHFSWQSWTVLCKFVL